jgi:2-dehydro-3-deoxygluconokinase
VDVLIGNEEDFTTALGFEVENASPSYSALDLASYERMVKAVVVEYPNLAVVGTTLRRAETATRNDWGAVCYAGGRFYPSGTRIALEIFDRIGGGDSFASGLIYGFLVGKPPEWAVECGAAHGALAMTTPGDTSMAKLADVEKAMRGLGTRVER